MIGVYRKYLKQQDNKISEETYDDIAGKFSFPPPGVTHFFFAMQALTSATDIIGRIPFLSYPATSTYH